MNPLTTTPTTTTMEDGGNTTMKCPHCSYEWKSRVKKPAKVKRCPLCQKWINKPKKETPGGK